jgi:hypothetical protein
LSGFERRRITDVDAVDAVDAVVISFFKKFVTLARLHFPHSHPTRARFHLPHSLHGMP